MVWLAAMEPMFMALSPPPPPNLPPPGISECGGASGRATLTWKTQGGVGRQQEEGVDSKGEGVAKAGGSF